MESFLHGLELLADTFISDKVTFFSYEICLITICHPYEAATIY